MADIAVMTTFGFRKSEDSEREASSIDFVLPGFISVSMPMP